MVARLRGFVSRVRSGVAAALVTGLVAALGVGVVMMATVPGGSPVVAPGSGPSELSASRDSVAAIQAPASASPTTTSKGLVVTVALQPSRATSVAQIPLPALVAYHRAEAVMNTSDTGCGLSWTVLAAVGEVINHHGEIAGHHLSAAGVERPALFGAVVRDASGRQAADSDAGSIDAAKDLDRSVGPMSLPPSTWAVAGVDADGDGRRDPQNINDAALAVAVLLCSGPESLANMTQLRVALGRLSPDPAFVRAVVTAAGKLRPMAASPTPDPVTVAAARPSTSQSPALQAVRSPSAVSSVEETLATVLSASQTGSAPAVLQWVSYAPSAGGPRSVLPSGRPIVSPRAETTVTTACASGEPSPTAGAEPADAGESVSPASVGPTSSTATLPGRSPAPATESPAGSPSASPSSSSGQHPPTSHCRR